MSANAKCNSPEFVSRDFVMRRREAERLGRLIRIRSRWSLRPGID
jgi:hypothetical protein